MTLVRRMSPALLLIVAACTTSGPKPSAIHDPVILEVRRGQTVVSPNAFGDYPALPAQGVRIKLQAQWPGELDVTFDEKIPLMKRAQQVPDAVTGGAGYYYVESIDPNPKPQLWQIGVIAPSDRRSNPLWVIGITSKSGTAGGPVSDTTNVRLVKPPVVPVEPASGSVSLTINERGTGGSCTGFRSYEESTSPEFEGIPSSALVTGVKNDTIYDLVVSHVDDTGRQTNCVPILSNATNTADFTSGGFANMRFGGEWNVRLKYEPPPGPPYPPWTVSIVVEWKK